jgi:beta-lactam-binding protein with PASTA domain
MGSPAPKVVASDVAEALAAFAKSGRKVEKIEPNVASNLRKTKYVGRKALAGAVETDGNSVNS